MARPDRWFLGLQLGVGASSLLGMLALLHPPRLFGFAAFVEHYYATVGFMHGDYAVRSAGDAARLLYAHALAPLLVMGAPVLLMGASFPFAQALVARRLDSLGRRTGTLLFANICGNVAGGAATGFALLDRLGTAGTLQLFGGLLLLPGLAAAATLATPRRRLAASRPPPRSSAAPSPPSRPTSASGPSSTARPRALRAGRGPGLRQRAGGARRGDLPLHQRELAERPPVRPVPHPHRAAPSLMHERPARGLAVGLGIGSTAYAMAQDPRIARVDCVEICGGERRLIAELARRGSSASRRLLADPRIRLATGDGRRWLLARPEPYDVIVVDAVRPNTAYAGNLYSLEFYELVASRLAPDGLFVQWIPTERVLNGVRRVFRYVAIGEVPDYFASRFIVASNEPLRLPPPHAARAVRGSGSESLLQSGAVAPAGRVFRRQEAPAPLAPAQGHARCRHRLQPRPPPARRVLSQSAVVVVE